MIYVIEGTDAVGKSSIIQKLKETLTDLPVEIIHSTFPEGETNEEKFKSQKHYFTELFNRLKDEFTTKHFILDRAWGPETFYSPMYRGKEATYILKLEEKFLKAVGLGNVSALLIESPLEDIKRRFTETRDAVLDPCPKDKEIIDLQKKFRKMAKESHMYYKTVDNADGTDLNALVKDLTSTKFIAQIYGNIPMKTNSHTKGWADHWAKFLDCPTTNNPHDLVRADTLYIDHGVNFGGSFNLFGGVNDQATEKLQWLIDSNADLISLDIEMPAYHSILPARIGKNSTSENLTTDLIEKFTELVTRNQDRHIDMRKMDGFADCTNHVISDSHGASVARRGSNGHIATVDRTNGKTLHNFVRNFDYDISGKENVTLCFGNIDIRHHACRHSDKDWVTLVADYVKIAKQMALVNKSITIVTPYPVEFEERKLPKTGYYKGTPFYGTREERNQMIDIFIKVVDKLTANIDNIDRIGLSQDYYDMDPEAYAKECMEGTSSVHTNPVMYIDNNPEAWINTRG